MANFRPTDRLTSVLLPPSIDEWLPERDLARFVVEVIEGLDLSAMSKSYRGTGSASYHLAALLGLLVHGYATGVFWGRIRGQIDQPRGSLAVISSSKRP